VELLHFSVIDLVMRLSELRESLLQIVLFTGQEQRCCADDIAVIVQVASVDEEKIDVVRGRIHDSLLNSDLGT
jgi:hypothetical protein